MTTNDKVVSFVRGTCTYGFCNEKAVTTRMIQTPYSSSGYDRAYLCKQHAEQFDTTHSKEAQT